MESPAKFTCVSEVNSNGLLNEADKTRQVIFTNLSIKIYRLVCICKFVWTDL